MCEFLRVLLAAVDEMTNNSLLNGDSLFFLYVVCTHLDPALLLTICFCATTTSDFDLKSHTDYTSKNINIIIKIHLSHVASKCTIFNTVKVLPPKFRHKVLLRGSDKKHQIMSVRYSTIRIHCHFKKPKNK
jgi:hypothetical protein